LIFICILQALHDATYIITHLAVVNVFVITLHLLPISSKCLSLESMLKIVVRFSA